MVPEVMVGSFKIKGNFNMLLLQLSCPERHIHHLVPWQDSCAPHSCAPTLCPLHQKRTHQRPALVLWKGSGCAWRDLGRSRLGRCTGSEFGSGLSLRCVEDPLPRWPWDFCWTLSSALLTRAHEHLSIPW